MEIKAINLKSKVFGKKGEIFNSCLIAEMHGGSVITSITMEEYITHRKNDNKRLEVGDLTKGIGFSLSMDDFDERSKLIALD